MDIINSLAPAVKLEVLTQKAGEIIARLQQAGLFRAIVIEQRGNSVLLDTAYGKLSGKSEQNLNKGDEILARIGSHSSEPTLKVEQHRAKVISLDKTAIKLLADQVSTKPVIARVISQQAQSTQLQIQSQTLNLPKQAALQTGETLLLKPGKHQGIEVSRIKPQVILKTALANLLPRLSGLPETHLSTLQKLSAEILSAKTEPLEARLLKQPKTVISRSAEPAQNVQIKTTTPAQPAQPAQSAQALAPAQNTQATAFANREVTSSSQLKNILAALARPLAPIEGLRAESVKHLLGLFTLLKPGVTDNNLTTPKTVPELLRVLASELKNSPDSMRLLVNQVYNKQSGGEKTATSERLLQDLSAFLKLELLQQSEHNLNQILTQKTALKLQVENNQPIQINLNIPIQVENESRNVELRIREKQRNEQASEQHWEIDLSFEFGLLGLISTHILLLDNKLSAHFWAQSPQTKTLIENHLDQFKGQLQKSGFETGLFNCYLGSPPENTDDKPVLVNENLVDIKV